MPRAARPALLLLMAVVATAVPPRAARAGDAEVDGLIEQARREKAALRYQEGLDLLDRALRLGRSGPAELIAIHRLAGELAAGLDDANAAAMHFRQLLAMAPATTLPEGTSPKVTAPFAVAAADIGARGPLRVRFVDRRGPQRRLEVVVDSDPAAQVAAARVLIRADGETPPRTLQAAVVGGHAGFTLPAGRFALDAAALDRHGNTLAEQVANDPAAGALSAGTSPPLYARWWPWAAVSVLFAGGATWAGLEALDAQARLDDIAGTQGASSWEETRAIERHGRRAALLANIGFGAAAATAVLSGYLFVRERRSSAVVTTTGDGVGFAFTGRF